MITVKDNEGFLEGCHRFRAENEKRSSSLCREEASRMIIRIYSLRIRAQNCLKTGILKAHNETVTVHNGAGLVWEACSL